MGVGAIVAGPCCALGPLVVTEDFPTSVSVMVAVNEGDISGSSMKASVTAAALGVYVGAFFEVNGCFCGIFAKSLSISSRWDSKRSVSFNIFACVGICRIALIAEVLGLSLVSAVLALSSRSADYCCGGRCWCWCWDFWWSTWQCDFAAVVEQRQGGARVSPNLLSSTPLLIFFL